MRSEETFDKITVPEHIRRIDLTQLKPNDFETKFMDDKCVQCLYYKRCRFEHAQGLFASFVDGDQRVTWCPRHIGEAFKQYSILKLLLDQKGLLTKETLDDYQGTQSLECIKQLKLIAQVPEAYVGNYYIYGDNSTQKTTMAKALAKKLCYPIARFKQECNSSKPTDPEIDVQYISMNKLMKLLSNSIDFDNDREQKALYNADIETLRKAEYLFIDEAFDPTKATFYKTGFMLAELDEFLRYRLEDRSMYTFFISNVKPEDISDEYFGKSLRELVVRSLTQVFEFKDNITEIKKAQKAVPVRIINK